MGPVLYAFGTLNAGAVGDTLVAATAGKKIVVRSVLVSGSTATLSCTVRFKSDATAITPWLRAAGTASFQLLPPVGAYGTAAGEALKADNPLSDAAVYLIGYTLE